MVLHDRQDHFVAGLQGRAKGIRRQIQRRCGASGKNDFPGVTGVDVSRDSFTRPRIRLDGAVMPRYYVMPWAQSTAEELEDAVEEAARKNGTVILRQPFYRRSFLETGQMNVEVVLPSLPNVKPPPFPPKIFNPRAAPEKSI